MDTDAAEHNQRELTAVDFDPLPGIDGLEIAAWQESSAALRHSLLIADRVVRQTPNDLAGILWRMCEAGQYPALAQQLAAEAERLGELQAALYAAVVRLAIVAARQG